MQVEVVGLRAPGLWVTVVVQESMVVEEGDLVEGEAVQVAVPPVSNVVRRVTGREIVLRATRMQVVVLGGKAIQHMVGAGVDKVVVTQEEGVLAHATSVGSLAISVVIAPTRLKSGMIMVPYSGGVLVLTC